MLSSILGDVGTFHAYGSFYQVLLSAKEIFENCKQIPIRKILIINKKNHNYNCLCDEIDRYQNTIKNVPPLSVECLWWKIFTIKNELSNVEMKKIGYKKISQSFSNYQRSSIYSFRDKLQNTWRTPKIISNFSH